MEHQLSRELEWFLDTLRGEFGVEVDVSDIGTEATTLGITDVEDFYVPNEVLDNPPETLLYEIMIVDDEFANVWVGVIAFYPDSPEWCLQVVTKNDEIVFRNVLPLCY